MLIVERFRHRRSAIRARRTIVNAQIEVDRVLEKIWGQPVFPPAKDAYVVIRDGKGFALAVDDPSLEATV